jgi:hypothetical protein
MAKRVISLKSLICDAVEATASEVGIGTHYPLGFTESELVYWHWRPNWNHAQVSCNGEISVTDQSGESTQSVTSSVSSSEVPNQAGSLQNEAHLVCNYSFDPTSPTDTNFFSIDYRQAIEQRIDSISLRAISSAYANVSFYTRRIKSYGGLYYPRMYFGGDASGDTYGGHISGWEWNLANSSAGSNFTVQATIFGKTVTAYGYSETRTDLDPAYSSSITNPTTASLTPTAFWPYSAPDGSPIYNTTTGDALQSPFA